MKILKVLRYRKGGAKAVKLGRPKVLPMEDVICHILYMRYMIYTLVLLYINENAIKSSSPLADALKVFQVFPVFLMFCIRLNWIVTLK